MLTDRPKFQHIFTVCPACGGLQTATQPCGCRRGQAPAPPSWSIWLLFGLAGYGLVSLLLWGCWWLARAMEN